MSYSPLLRAYKRQSTAQRNSAYEAKFKSNLETSKALGMPPPQHRPHKPKSKKSGKAWNVIEEGTGADILSYWSNKRKDVFVREEWAPLNEVLLAYDNLAVHESTRALCEALRIGEQREYVY